MPKVTRRKERRKQQRERYLSGESRHPYCHTPALETSFSEGSSNETSGESETTTTKVCAKCEPVLLRYADIFKQLVHQGTELKKKKKVNPNPKKRGTHYRDVKRQNDWLRENMFDAMGNYLFCCGCIRMAFGISKQRIARQRAIKQKQFKEPLQNMTKAEVEKEHLGEYVVMPGGLDISFKSWWRFLDPSATVEVRHSRHGNSGKVSNSSVMNDFLEFVDVNSQPNGRSADSTGPTFYFLPNYN